MANTNLAAARAAKNDEFYTQYHDIEAEMNAYLDYDPDVFRGKTVLLPCDDPEWGSFTRYFAARFRDLGLKRLISTSYAPGSKRYRDPLAADHLRDAQPALPPGAVAAAWEGLHPRPRRQRRRTDRHRRPAVGLPRGGRRLPQRGGDGPARHRGHHHHQPALLPLSGVPGVGRGRGPAVRHHREHQRDHLLRGVPADPGQ